MVHASHEVLVEELPEPAGEADPARPRLAEVLDRLPRRSVRPSRCCSFEGLSVAAAAARVGITTGALKVRRPPGIQGAEGPPRWLTRPLRSRTARTRALVQRLLDEAAPVRRLWTPTARLGLWLVVVATIAGAVDGAWA